MPADRTVPQVRLDRNQIRNKTFAVVISNGEIESEAIFVIRVRDSRVGLYSGQDSAAQRTTRRT